jgi:flagellar biosynthetic protein FlhB
MADDYQDKTEQPTPKRRAEARKKGSAAKSRDLSAAVVLMVGLASLFIWGPSLNRKIMEMLQVWLGGLKPGLVGPNQVAAIFMNFSLTLAALLTPILLSVSVAAIAVNYAQVGKIFSTERITPDLSRIFKLDGLKRFFSANSLVELLKNLAKIALVGLVAYFSVVREIPSLLPLLDQEVGQIFIHLAATTFRVAIRVIVALLALAALDYLYQRYTFEKNLKMTKQEVKDEMRQTEGDPKVKARIKSLMRQVATKRMIADVPTADVVVTNPTHVAVALKYDSATMVAPMVVAKGQGFIALKIIAMAQEAGVPRVENRPLARSLYKMVEVGRSIPTELYRAVAEVLAYIYKLRGAAQGGVR